MLIFPLTFTKTPGSCRTLKRLITVRLMMFLDFDFVNLYIYYTLDCLVEREHAVEQLFRTW